jgi:hypothetical protein
VPGQLVAGQWRFNKPALVQWLSAFPQETDRITAKSSKQRILALAGLWADEPSADAIVAEAIRKRKADTAGS